MEKLNVNLTVGNGHSVQGHTPGPWKYARTHRASADTWYVITDAAGFGPIVEVGGKDKNWQIAEAKYLITDPQIIEANAAFIVKACNSHAELVSALEETVSDLERNGYKPQKHRALLDRFSKAGVGES